MTAAPLVDQLRQQLKERDAELAELKRKLEELEQKLATICAEQPEKA